VRTWFSFKGFLVSGRFDGPVDPYRRDSPFILRQRKIARSGEGGNLYLDRDDLGLERLNGSLVRCDVLWSVFAAATLPSCCCTGAKAEAFWIIAVRIKAWSWRSSS
jgi:hypothetical protein